MSVSSSAPAPSAGRSALPKTLIAALLFAVSLGNVACIEHAMVEAMKAEEEIDYHLLEPIEPTEGAIWRGETASGSFLYYDRKARGLGDLVTVVMVENISAEGSANTSTGKSSSIGAVLNSDIGLTGLVTDVTDFVLGLFGVAGVGQPAPGTSLSVLESSTNNDFEGDGNTTRSSSFTGTVTCRVMETLPGGILRIKGKRRLIVNHELQLITVSGLVRRSDISIDNTVASTQIANAQLTFDGLGVLDDKQRPALVARLMDWLYPF